MARRKARRRTITRYIKRKARRASKGFGAAGGAVVGGALYGAGRQYLQRLTAPIMAKMPMGQYGENIALGVASYLLYKNTKGVVKKAALTGLAIESAIAAGEVTAGFGGGGNGSFDFGY